MSEENTTTTSPEAKPEGTMVPSSASKPKAKAKAKPKAKAKNPIAELKSKIASLQKKAEGKEKLLKAKVDELNQATQEHRAELKALRAELESLEEKEAVERVSHKAFIPLKASGRGRVPLSIADQATIFLEMLDMLQKTGKVNANEVTRRVNVGSYPTVNKYVTHFNSTIAKVASE